MKVCAKSFVVEFWSVGAMQASLPFVTLATAIEGAKIRTKGKSAQHAWIFAVFPSEDSETSMVRVGLVSEGRLDPC